MFLHIISIKSYYSPFKTICIRKKTSNLFILLAIFCFQILFPTTFPVIHPPHRPYTVESIQNSTINLSNALHTFQEGLCVSSRYHFASFGGKPSSTLQQSNTYSSCHSKDKTGNCHTKGKNPVTEDHLLHDFIHRRCPEWATLQNRKQISGCSGLGEGGLWK